MKRVAIVTGAGQGIGLAIARRLAKDGYRVAVAEIREEAALRAADELRAEGFEAIAVQADVSSLSSLENLMAKVAEAFGGIDVLVNNAGILFSTPVEEITEREWDAVTGVDLKGLFFAIQKALPYLKKSVSARIINISSVAGRMGSYNSGMSYVASKGGVLSLTRGLARRLAPHGITVNAVCPGTIESDMIKQWTPERVQVLLNNIPLGRLGRPDDIANGVAFLASEASDFVTGVSLDINGGMYMG